MMIASILAPGTHHTPTVPTVNLQISIGLLVILIGGVIFLAAMLRKFTRSQALENSKGDWTGARADMENPSAFMTASMQGVIEKLRAQEKELARLHLLAQ
jgi:hypothetical protein